MINLLEVECNYGIDRSGHAYNKVEGQWQRVEAVEKKMEVLQGYMLKNALEGDREALNHMIIACVNAYNHMYGVTNEDDDMTLKEAEEYVLQDYEKVDAAFSIGEFDYSYEEIDELGERIEILLKVYGTIYALRNDEEPIHYDDQDMLKSLINGELH